MKSRTDLVRGWLRKADSDLANAQLCLAAGQALDTACFHAQQAAEKCIKAYLTACGAQFPLIHNLEKLIDVCVQYAPGFVTLRQLAQELTPYAVELRYDAEFWPTAQAAEQALAAATAVREFVLQNLPPDMRPTA